MDELMSIGVRVKSAGVGGRLRYSGGANWTWCRAEYRRSVEQQQVCLNGEAQAVWKWRDDWYDRVGDVGGKGRPARAERWVTDCHFAMRPTGFEIVSRDMID